MVTPILLLLIKVIPGINKLLMGGHTHVVVVNKANTKYWQATIVNGYTHIVVINKGNTRY